MQNIISKNRENNKLTKFLLFICVLVIVENTSEFALRPEKDVFLITLRILGFIISLFITGTILAYSKPEIVNIIIWPLCIIAILLVLL